MQELLRLFSHLDGLQEVLLVSFFSTPPMLTKTSPGLKGFLKLYEKEAKRKLKEEEKRLNTVTKEREKIARELARKEKLAEREEKKLKAEQKILSGKYT